MRYQLYRMEKNREDDRYLTFATTIDNARKRALELYTGKPIMIKRVSDSNETDVGYIAMNNDGFYYHNLERRTKQFLRSDGTLIQYR